MHSKPYISLIGHAGDNHGISNRENDDMSRDPPLPGARQTAGPAEVGRWEIPKSEAKTSDIDNLAFLACI